jgi:hypothetical protein
VVNSSRVSAPRWRSPQWRNRRALRTGPTHDRNAADAVLWAAFDDAIAVGNVHQYVAFAIEKADDLQGFEQETAPLVEDALPVLQFTGNFDWAYLAAGNAGITGVLGDPEAALQPAGLRSTDVASDALDLGVVKPVDYDFVIRPEQVESGTDRAGGAPLGPAVNPHNQQNDDQQRTCP